jgi:hypothetical protein
MKLNPGLDKKLGLVQVKRHNTCQDKWNIHSYKVEVFKNQGETLPKFPT